MKAASSFYREVAASDLKTLNMWHAVFAFTKYNYHYDELEMTIWH